MEAQRVAQRRAEYQVFAEVPDGAYIHFVPGQGGSLRGQPPLDRGEDAGVVVDIDTAAAGHEEDERQHGDDGDPGDNARGFALDFASDLRILRSRSVVCRGLESVFVSHNASQSSKNVPTRRGRAGTFTKGAGVKAPLSQVLPDSRVASTVQTQSKLCSHTKETMDMQRTPGKSGRGRWRQAHRCPLGSRLQLTQDVDHLDGADAALEALVAGLGARAFDGLLDGVSTPIITGVPVASCTCAMPFDTSLHTTS